MLPEEQNNITIKTAGIDLNNPNISNTLDLDFENGQLNILDGTPKLIRDIEAVKKWITLFILTPKDTYKIYEGTNFGTSIRKLFGKKIIGLGYEEAEIKRELEEGFTLCPAISRIENFRLYKKGRCLCIDLAIVLKDGTIINADVEDVYEIRGYNV